MKKHVHSGARKLLGAVAAIALAVIGFTGCEQPAADTPAADNPGTNNPGPTDPGPGDELTAVTTSLFTAAMEHNQIDIELTGGKFAEKLELSHFTFSNAQQSFPWGANVERNSDIKATVTGVNVPQNWSGTKFKVTIKPEAFAVQPSSAAATALTVTVIPVPKYLTVGKSTFSSSYGQISIKASESVPYDKLGKYLQAFIIYWSESESSGYTQLARVENPEGLSSLSAFQKDVLIPGKTYWYRVSAVYPEGESAQCAAVSYTHVLDGDELSLGEIKESEVQKQQWTPGFKYFHFAVEKDAQYSIVSYTSYTGTPYTGKIYLTARYGYASNTSDTIANRIDPKLETKNNPYTFTASKDGYVVLTVENQPNGSGTFGIKVEKTAAE